MGNNFFGEPSFEKNIPYSVGHTQFQQSTGWNIPLFYGTQEKSLFEHVIDYYY